MQAPNMLQRCLACAVLCQRKGSAEEEEKEVA